VHLKRQEGGSQVGALGACWISLEGLEVDLWVVPSEIPWVINEVLLLVDLCMVLVWCLAGEASCLMVVVAETMVVDFVSC